jgi:hypothetical protein
MPRTPDLGLRHLNSTSGLCALLFCAVPAPISSLSGDLGQVDPLNLRLARLETLRLKLANCERLRDSQVAPGVVNVLPDTAGDSET